MPRFSAVSFRFQCVRWSVLRISPRSASRAAVREMAFSEQGPAGAAGRAPMPGAVDEAAAGVEVCASLTRATDGGGLAAAGGGRWAAPLVPLLISFPVGAPPPTTTARLTRVLRS